MPPAERCFFIYNDGADTTSHCDNKFHFRIFYDGRRDGRGHLNHLQIF